MLHLLPESLRRSLRAKVTLGVVLPLLLILGAFTTMEYVRHRAIVLTDLSLIASLSGQVIEDNLRHDMLTSDFEAIQGLLDSVAGSEEIQIVYLLDTSGRVIFAPYGAGVGEQLSNLQPDCQPCHRYPPDARPDSVVVTADDGQRVFRSMKPIENAPECARCHDPEDRLLGLLLTDVSTARLEAALAADLRGNLSWWIGTIVVTVLLVNLVVSRFVLRRLESIVAAMADFGHGKLPRPLPERQPDEIGQLARTFNLMAQQVQARDAENRELSEKLQRQSVQRGELLKRLITAQEDERKRLARELHDELGQALSGLALRVEATERFIASAPRRALQPLAQIRALVTQTTDRMYDLILALRPSALDDLGLAAAVRAHAERLLAGSGIAFELAADELMSRLPPEMETALYRTFQEALSNVVRHAGASHVRVTLARHDGVFEAEVLDDGRGFDLESVRVDGETPRGLGLLGMQERVAACGGDLEILSRPGEGTRLRVCIPLVETGCV